MRDIDSTVHCYVEAIKSSEEYQDYAREKDKVKRYPELKAQIDAYRMLNFQMQQSGETGFEVIERFENEYSEFRENPLVADFLAAELAFCRLMQDLSLRVTTELEFE